MRNPSTAAAFSLVEVMVASAVLAIVMAILLGTLTTSMALWRNTESKLAADREGRAGEMLLVQDLANAVMPASANLWPSVASDGGNVFLRFLTSKPAEYQNQAGGNLGDVCFVQYFLSADGTVLNRAINASAWTYENVIKRGVFPAVTTNGAQLLSANLLADARDAVRGLVLYSEASTNGFVLLATNNPGQAGNLLPVSGAPTLSNPPVAVEVNFSAADADAMANKDLLGNANYKLRNAGYYSFRVALPKPTR